MLTLLAVLGGGAAFAAIEKDEQLSAVGQMTFHAPVIDGGDPT